MRHVEFWDELLHVCRVAHHAVPGVGDAAEHAVWGIKPAVLEPAHALLSERDRVKVALSRWEPCMLESAPRPNTERAATMLSKPHASCLPAHRSSQCTRFTDTHRL